MKLKHILSLVVMFFSSLMMSAQEGMSVKSFDEMPNDLDARVAYPKNDQNGVKCALVKIVTTEGDFTFDNGYLGVIAAVHKPELSEWWVYLPENTRKLKIMHPLYGQLTDGEAGFFYFPNALKSATCYRMELTTQRKVVTYEPTKVKTGYLIINSTPEGGQVYLTENGVENYVGTTPFQKKLQYGTYNYRIKKSLYHDEVGVAEVDNTRVVQEIPLRPAFGSLKVTTTPSGATVTIEGVNASFTTPCEIPNIASGNYYVNIVKSQYSAHRQLFTIEDGKSTSLDVALDARFAPVKIETLPGAKVVINGEQRGFGGFSGNLDEGIYDIEVSLAQHRSVSRQIEVVANKPQTITLNPTPIYGSLDIETTPMYADITINGKNYGNTPTAIDELLIGNYEVKLQKEGYIPISRQVEIKEGEAYAMNETLQKMEKYELKIESNVSDASVYINNEYKGRAPLTITGLDKGDYAITLTKHGYESRTRNISLSDKPKYSIYVNMREKEARPSPQTSYQSTSIANTSATKSPKKIKEKKEDPMRGIFNFGVESGFGWAIGQKDGGMGSFASNLYGKYNINSDFALGIGVGLLSFLPSKYILDEEKGIISSDGSDAISNYTGFPVFARVQYTMGKYDKKCRPFLACDYGWVFGNCQSQTLEPQIGISIYLQEFEDNKRVKFNLALSYSYKDRRYSIYDINNNEVRFTGSAICLKLGVDF